MVRMQAYTVLPVAGCQTLVQIAFGGPSQYHKARAPLPEV